MKLNRNNEVYKETAAYFAVTLALALAGLRFSGRRCALLVFVCGFLLCALHYYFAAGRYKKIAELSKELDKLLHGEGSFSVPDCSEGELSILTSEVEKLTVRLREQSDALLADKIHLTDAIADIFHQLRTPLTSMNLVVSLLSSEDLGYEKRIELTRDLKRQLERMQWLVEALLKMSKIDAGTAVFEKKNVKVKDLIEKASQPFLIPMELRGIRFETVCKDESLEGDIAWLTEAVGNLIKNATEHTGEGGSVCVACRETALFTELTVEDSGEGFDEADIPHLFERFYKGSNASEGSIGIGLALSRSIITAQGGTVKAENRKDGGARFVIRFYKNII